MPIKTKKCKCGIKIHHWKDFCKDCQKKKDFRQFPLKSYLIDIGVPPKTAKETQSLYPHLPNILNSTLSSFFEKTFQSSLFLSGPTYCGKTTAAVGILIYNMEQKFSMKSKKYRLLFTTCPGMLQEIKFSFKQPYPAEQKIIEKYQSADLLVIDDFGVEGTGDWVFTTLYLIITHRYEHGLFTIFTSNLTIDQISEKFGDKRITRRIKDQCRIIQMKR